MSGFNYKRKLFHLLGFILPFFYYIDIFHGAYGLVNASRAVIFTILLIQVVLLSSIEFLRLHNESFKSWFFKSFGMIMKEGESNRMNATVPYLFSNALVVLFFPPEFFFLAVGYLLIGDPVAAFFGSKYGKFRFYNGKSLVGILAFITASILLGIFFLNLFANTNPNSILALYKNDSFNLIAIFAVIISSICAGLAEFFSAHAWKGFLDDNLTIPLAAAFSLAIVFLLTGADFYSIFFRVNELFL
jgi:dolichol kinase